MSGSWKQLDFLVRSKHFTACQSTFFSLGRFVGDINFNSPELFDFSPDLKVESGKGQCCKLPSKENVFLQHSLEVAKLRCHLISIIDYGYNICRGEGIILIGIMLTRAWELPK